MQSKKWQIESYLPNYLNYLGKFGKGSVIFFILKANLEIV